MTVIVWGVTILFLWIIFLAIEVNHLRKKLDAWIEIEWQKERSIAKQKISEEIGREKVYWDLQYEVWGLKERIESIERRLREKCK
jgi:predicted Holliday junction resolvase-like endonuclease